MILLFLLSQTINLDRVTHDSVAVFETNEHGHFLYDRSDHVFHWAPNGKLLHTITNRAVIALHPVRGGYALNWIDEKAGTYGIEFISTTGAVVQSLAGMHSPWFFHLRGKLWGAPDIWSENEDLVLPIEVSGKGLHPTMKRKPFFRPAQVDPTMPMSPDFKRVWVVEEEEDKVFAMTPLSPKIYLFQGDRFLAATMPKIDWKPYRIQYHSSGMKWKPWARSFNRVTHFGAAGDSLVVSVDQLDGETTKVYFLSPAGTVIREVSIAGWCREGKVLGGTDGVNAWIFDPSTLSVTAIQP